jgi:predicted TPR repeat methyltransferase
MDTPPLPANLAPERPAADALTVPDALAYATRLHRTGHLEAAQTLYERILQACPQQPDALNFLAILKHQTGRVQEALELIRAASREAPQSASIWNNLGNVCLSQGLFEEATQAYQRSLSIHGQDADILSNLGVLWRARGQTDAAEQAYLQSLRFRPDSPDTLNNLGHLYSQMGRVDEAVQRYCQALVLNPEHASARRLLGMAYYTLGRLEDAARVYREWLELEPESEAARHHLAACTGQQVPERAGAAYVQNLFDGFAASFESKLASLVYRAPQLVAQACQARLSPHGGTAWRILDAGCGTGLMAPFLKPWASRLCGIDLSAGMLNVAREKNLYDACIQTDLTAFLHAEPEKSAWDLIVSADTLCYFGALDVVLSGAFQSLSAVGWLFFTVEALEHQSLVAGLSGQEGQNSQSGRYAPNWHLLPHGRYAHQQPYLRTELQEAGFTRASIELVDLRLENGVPVKGWLVSAQKAAGQQALPSQAFANPSPSYPSNPPIP